MTHENAVCFGAVLLGAFIYVFVGDAFHWTGERESFMQELNGRMKSLAEEGKFPDWN